MSNLEYTLVYNFKCKRCGCTTYDKEFFTGFKNIDEENAIIATRYVCRNCDKPFNIDNYTKNCIITEDVKTLVENERTES